MTDAWNGFRGAALRIDDFDLPRIGHTIRVGEDELHALLDVEAAGSGFDSSGRPKMLFEPHVFYRNLSGAKRAQAVRAGLAYPKWGTSPYPKDSYPRLVAAAAIDETAAFRASSWGLGQILGENHRAVGYATPQGMVHAFMDDEAAHLEAMVAFLVANHIDDDLRRLAALTRPTTAADCAPIARAYNGSGYAAHNYHGRLAATHNRWRAIADTPWTPDEPDVPADTAMPVLRKGAGIGKHLILRPYVEKAQKRLALHGFPPGSIDGEFGGRTEAAVRAFQAATGLTPDGVIGGAESWPALLAQPTSASGASTIGADVGSVTTGKIAPDDPGPEPDPLGSNPPDTNPAPAGFFVALLRLLAAIGALVRR